MTNLMATQVKSKERHTAAHTTGLYNPRLSCNAHAHSAFCLVIVAVWQLFSSVNPTAIVSNQESNEDLDPHKKIPFKLKLSTQSCSLAAMIAILLLACMWASSCKQSSMVIIATSSVHAWDPLLAPPRHQHISTFLLQLLVAVASLRCPNYQS